MVQLLAGIISLGESWKRTRVARTAALTRYRYATQPTVLSLLVMLCLVFVWECIGKVINFRWLSKNINHGSHRPWKVLEFECCLEKCLIFQSALKMGNFPWKVLENDFMILKNIGTRKSNLLVSGLDTNGCPLGNSKLILLTDNLNRCLWLSACQVEKIDKMNAVHSFLQFLFVWLCFKENKEWFTSYTRHFHGWLVTHSQPGRYSLGGWWRCHANSHNVLRWVASSAKGHTLWMMCQWKMTWLINYWVMMLCINRTVEL